MSTINKGLKKSGKENVSPDPMDGYRSKSEVPSTSKEGRKIADLEKKIQALTAERDRLRGQRDDFGKQFEELSKMRNTNVETLFEKYKEKAAVQAKAQNDIISNQTVLTERLQAKVKDLEKALEKATALPAAGGPFEEPVKADPKEIKQLKEELSKAKATIKSKDEQFKNLEKEYKAEVQHSQNLQASRSGPAPSIATALPSSEEAAQDAASLRLYEDLSFLSIPSVKIRDTGKTGKEITFNCIQSHGGRSLNFKLRTFNELDAVKAKAKDPNPWRKMVKYNPEGLEQEPEEFRERLEVFAGEFTIPREQLAEMYESLRNSMVVEA